MEVLLSRVTMNPSDCNGKHILKQKNERSNRKV